MGVLSKVTPEVGLRKKAGEWWRGKVQAGEEREVRVPAGGHMTLS